MNRGLTGNWPNGDAARTPPRGIDASIPSKTLSAASIRPQELHTVASEIAEATSRLLSLLVPFEKANIATPSRAPVKVETDLEIAQRIVKKRAEREELFGLGLFTDPAWDVLLDLFIAREAGRKISISSVCVAARVPASTALRWIRELERRKLVVRITDAADRRRSYLVLTDESQMKISHLLKNIEAGTI